MITAPQTEPDAIIAIATAPGRGGIGVVRISGTALSWLIHGVLGRSIEPRVAAYAEFVGDDGELIDRGIALYFRSPHSYTGEDVLELQGHGGPIVLQRLVDRCLLIAAREGRRLRLAEAGEFTRRAFLNDKLDLAQAEAVADLIEAQTVAAARSAAGSLAGAFSREIHTLVERVVRLRTLVEATLDFPEEEIDFLQTADALGQLDAIDAQLADVLAAARQGALLRDGLKVVLAGVPNAGKSSLLNALAGQDIAIVTPIAGTTRDKVQQTISLDGIPLLIVDTAGLRETDDEVEAIGVERSWRELEGADVIVHIHDLERPDDVANEDIAQRIRQIAPRVPIVRVFNKCDAIGTAPRVSDSDVWLSAKTSAGLDALRAELRRAVGIEAHRESVFIARERHLIALRAAQAHLAQARRHAAVDGTMSDRHLDLFAEELRLAQERCNEITGAFTSDDLLGVIFSSFCIGK